MSQLRHRLAESVKTVSSQVSARLYERWGSRAGEGFGILFYHRIHPEVPGLPEPMLNVTPDRFRAQLAGLQAEGFAFWSLQQVLDAHAGGTPIPKRTVVVTFDDAFANLKTYAWPILQELQVPATIFLVTGYTTLTVPMHFDAWGCAHYREAPPEAWRSLTWDECREMDADPLITFGAHTHTHRDMRGKEAVFEEDLRTCFDLLAAELGGPRPQFAFPFGDPAMEYVTPALIRAARRAGAGCALTTRTGLVYAGDDPFSWPRLEVIEHDNAETLAAKLTGWYNWVRNVRDTVHKVSPW